MTNLVLYDFPESVCCQKIRLVIAEKGIPVTHVEVRLDEGRQYSDEFMKLNPRGTVPVAVHNGHIITESTVINEYLEEVYGGPALMPETPEDRAKARYWSLLVDQGIHNPHTTALSFVVALRYAFLEKLNTSEKISQHLRSVRDPVSREMQRQGFELAYEAPAFTDAVTAFIRLIEEMDSALEKTEWLVGGVPTLADFNLAPYIHRLDCLGLARLWDDLSNLSRWYDALRRRASWSSAITKAHIQRWLELMEKGGLEALPHVRRVALERRRQQASS